MNHRTAAVTQSDDTKILSHRAQLRVLIERPGLRYTILALVILNAALLGLSTSDWVMERFSALVYILDRAILAIFVLELLTKFYAYGRDFFKDAWNLFDLFVVSLGLLPQTTSMSALRALRVIRALRILSAVPQMRAVVQALFDALPGMGAVSIMLVIVFYVFAVMATIMFGGAFEPWFGTVGESFYTLFQVMTLESWSMGIVRPVMEVYPYAWAFFVPFIAMTAFSVLNLFIGLLVNTMQSAVDADAEQEFERLRDLVKLETDSVDQHVQELRTEIQELRAEIRALAGIKNG